MLSVTDKVAILRSVSIFAATPDDILTEVASLLQPVEVKAGEMVIQKGDTGECMYLVVRGRVRVHDGERVIHYLGAADVFGEMALLDAQPRAASVSAEEDTDLFRLDQAVFYALMNNRTEVAHGIILVLSRHLRERVQEMAQDFVYIQQMGRLTAAAAALEAGQYDARSIDEVAQRSDALGQLARVFQRMANEVQSREEKLKAEVHELRIQIDETRRAREVKAVTDSAYFQALQQKAKTLRKKEE